MIQALIFDFDGLLVDTETPAFESWRALYAEYGHELTLELWQGALAHSTNLWESPWPVADEAMLQHETIELVLQVNGKVRDRVQVPAGLSEDELIERARASEKVQAHLNGEERRVIVVPDKLVNIVV